MVDFFGTFAAFRFKSIIMPELPEVQTTVNELNQKVRNRTFVNVWTDSPKQIKKPRNFSQFKKELLNKKIIKVRRRAKNILFDLTDKRTLLIHQKLTGHLLYGKWMRDKKTWKPSEKGDIDDPLNRFLHLLFFLDNGKQLALSDLRKFAKVELWDNISLAESKEMKNLGCEPLDTDFTFRKFKECLLKGSGRIKQILMNQSIIAGIGNIYSDEILWRAKVHPCKRLVTLNEKELKAIYNSIKIILTNAIKYRGTTIASNVEEYRDVSGRRGNYQNRLKVYRREKQECSICGGKVERMKVGARSWHYCPKCQIP